MDPVGSVDVPWFAALDESFGLNAPHTFDVRTGRSSPAARAACVLGDLDRALAVLEAHVALEADGHAFAVLYEVHLARGTRAAELAVNELSTLLAMHPASPRPLLTTRPLAVERQDVDLCNPALSLDGRAPCPT